MHIVVFLAGTVVLTACCVLAGWAVGLSGWLLAGLGLCVLVLAQGVYLIFVGAMVRSEQASLTPKQTQDSANDDHAPVQES